MTETEKRRVAEIRAAGHGYKSISNQLGISVNTISSYCRRNTLETMPEKKCEKSLSLRTKSTSPDGFVVICAGLKTRGRFETTEKVGVCNTNFEAPFNDCRISMPGARKCLTCYDVSIIMSFFVVI